ncbi:MAG: DUF4129 domain-containing protein [Planctomycetota bacterium]|nr:MAG: DUF4129 domain-containing protein [Planctomycetota bacterium]REJ91143.1 MAG: DUF4129 domain-containing protein [Planctomycetota bacterium]REK20376.1 MAG: DUF4129 domain-containing protein [Planctomycetota bacterium]REK26873.1 MAG: DUF4129 domain-containing protein [Planctomycetota bacterium]
MPAENLPPPDEIRRVAAEVLKRPEFHPDSLSNTTGAESIWLEILKWIWGGIEWLAAALAFLPAALQIPVAILLVLLLGFVVVRMILGVSRVARLPQTEEALRQRQRRALYPADLEKMATEAHQQGDAIEAVRLLFRAAILRLENAEKRPNRPGSTNRELLRKYRAAEIHSPLKTMADTIEMKWFGGRPSEPDDYDRSREAYESLCSVVTARLAAERTDAHEQAS